MITKEEGESKEADRQGDFTWQNSATPHFEPTSGLPTVVFPLRQVWTLSFTLQLLSPSSLLSWLLALSSSSGKLGEMAGGL